MAVPRGASSFVRIHSADRAVDYPAAVSKQSPRPPVLGITPRAIWVSPRKSSLSHPEWLRCILSGSRVNGAKQPQK